MATDRAWVRRVFLAQLVASALAIFAGIGPAPGLLHAGFPNDLEGRSTSAASLRGHVVVVAFLATWLIPSHADVRFFQRLYTQHRGQGLRVIGVAENGLRSLGELGPFLRAAAVTFPVVPDPEHAVFARYHPASMPAAFLFDRRGVLQDVWQGPERVTTTEFEREVRALMSDE